VQDWYFVLSYWKKNRTLTLSSFRVMHLSSVLRTSQICHVFSWSIFLLVGTWVDPSTYQPCRPTFRMLELSTPSYLLCTPSSSGCWQISCKRFLPANCYLSMNSSKEPNLGIRFEENIHVQCGPLTLVAVVTSGVPDVTKFFKPRLTSCLVAEASNGRLRFSDGPVHFFTYPGERLDSSMKALC